MQKTTFIIIALLFGLNYITKSQANNTESNPNIENARYLEEDLTKLLQKKITYPLQALRNGIQGDVIVSFIVDKFGNLDSLNVAFSPDIILSTSSVVAIDQLENNWNPCKINGQPVDKKYNIAFRYRMYLDTQPPNYKKSAEKFVEKQKYEKALRFYNKALKYNKFDYRLFESRSKIKVILNDVEGSKIDFQESIRLQNEIISVVDIIVIGITRVEKKTEYR